MPKRTTDYRCALLEDLKNPAEAAHYLNAALEDSPEMFLSALRDVAEARQMSKVAEHAGVSRESLYRMLKASGNPTYRSFIGILQAIGLEFAGVRTPTAEPDPTPPPNPGGYVHGIIANRSSARSRQAVGSIVGLKSGMISNVHGSEVVLPKKPPVGADCHIGCGAAFGRTYAGGSIAEELLAVGGK